MNVPLTYICNALYDEDPDNEPYPLDLNPAVVRNSRVILAHEHPVRQEKAFLYTTLLKTVQTGKRAWVLVDKLKGRRTLEKIRDQFNAIVPHVARVDRFGYRDPSESHDPRIIVSTYHRFLNKLLERRVKGVRTVVLTDFDEGLQRNFPEKEVILSQLVHFRDVLASKSPVNASKRAFNVVLSWRRIPSTHDLVLAQLGLIDPESKHDEEAQDQKREHVIASHAEWDYEYLDLEVHAFTDKRHFDYFILGSCYRRAITKRNLRELLSRTQFGILCAMGHPPSSEDLRDLKEIVEDRVETLLEKGLLERPQEYYYRTSEFGRALVRYGIQIQDHDLIMEVILKHQEFLEEDLHHVGGYLLHPGDNYPDRFMASLEDFLSDLDDCYRETWLQRFQYPRALKDPYFSSIIKNVYLRIPFRRKEYEQEREEAEERDLVEACKAGIMDYIEEKPDPKMASLKELTANMDFLAGTMKQCLKELVTEGRLEYRNNKLVVLHRKVDFWGVSFPKHACMSCYFFTSDHLCAFWKIVAKEDQDLVPPYLMVRTRVNYNPAAHGCHTFFEKPRNFRVYRLEASKLKRDLCLELDPPESILLNATIFSKFARCRTDAVLTLLGFDPYNRAMQRGTERHRIFQRLTESIIRAYQSEKGEVEKASILKFLDILKGKFMYKLRMRFTTFEHLRPKEAVEFHDAYSQYLHDKIQNKEQVQFTREEIFSAFFGGFPKVEEEIVGSTIKGRADLVIYSENGIKILDLKSKGPYPEQVLQLAALAIAAEERARGQGEQVRIKDLIILTADMREHVFELTDKLREEIQRIKDEFDTLDPTELLLADECTNYGCEKRSFCTFDNLKDFKLRKTPGYKCKICEHRLEQLEYRDRFPSHATLQCRTCRTTYKHVEEWDPERNDRVSTIIITPDLDHVLVELAKKLGVFLPKLTPYRRREVKIIYPETEFDELRLEEGIFPVLENGDYPKLAQIGTIIDRKGCLSEELIESLKQRFNITVFQPEATVEYRRIDRFYDKILGIVRETEAFSQKLTLSSILSRFTFTRLALILLQNRDKRTEIQCWTILDNYLHALEETNVRILRAREGSAAAVMWDTIKPFFDAREVPINSRVLERRVHDQYLFHSIRTAAKSKGNALVNYYFLKCGEHARLVHNNGLLGWHGTAGLNHGRRRKTALDEMGLVVDLNENFKLIFLLGLLKALRDEEFTKWDVWSWIGSRRMRNHYLNWSLLESVDRNCENIWTNGYLHELEIEKANLKADYSNFLRELKEKSIVLCRDLLTQTKKDYSLLYYLGEPQNGATMVCEQIKHHCLNWISDHFEPFTLKSDLVQQPDDNRWNFFKMWKKEII